MSAWQQVLNREDVRLDVVAHLWVSSHNKARECNWKHHSEQLFRVTTLISCFRVKPTNSMSEHKNLLNVAVCREHLFCYGLNTAPIIFTHICIIHVYQWKDPDGQILFVLLCIAKLHTEYSHITMETKQPCNDSSHFQLHFP